MGIRSVLVVYAEPRNEEQNSALKTVTGTLKKHKIKYKSANRDTLDKSQFKGKELVIAVGGDGTFLRAAQFIGKQMLFGVNADVKNKEGFFMKSNKKGFEKKLEKILKNKARILELPRLQASIDGRKVGIMALNEFYIGSRKAYHAAKYIIKIGNKKERQKSSGVLVTTPAGSYSWAKSCRGKVLPLKSQEFQYIVREPYEGKVFKNYGITYGILSKGHNAEIISEMLDGIIVADSVSREFDFKEGKKAKIRLSNKKIRVVWE